MVARAETVTTLFTDLVSSTDLLQRAGDDDAQRIFQAHHRLLRDVVGRHGGHEVKWLGDGLMVAFDSALDAIRCAIEMQQQARRPAAGERLQIRVGLHVGEVLRDEGDYFGSAVVVARRLCDSGLAGDIRVSDVVLRLVDGRSEFSFDDLGELDLKGIARPVRAWRILHDHDARAMLAQTPFVGRENEMAVLDRELDEARSGRGRVVALVGEAGIGKTRICEELSARATMLGVNVVAGRCYDGEWALPLAPFIEAIRACASLVPTEVLRQDLSHDAPTLLRLVPELQDRLPEYAQVDSAESRGERQRLFDAIRGWLGRAAKRHPLMLVLDDLHWADEGTAALLALVGQSITAWPLLIVVTYRDVEVGPEHALTKVLPDLRRNANLRRLDLAGLHIRDVSTLLETVAGSTVSVDLAQNLAADTAGNPLFIREILLNLVERSGPDLGTGEWIQRLIEHEGGVPEGVREVIGRRVGRLSYPTRDALLAVCPMTGGFELDVMAHLVKLDEEAALDVVDEAIEARLIVERTQNGKIWYDFQHALIRDSLYEPMTASRRMVAHRHAAETIELVCAGRIDSYYEQLAYHYELAGIADKAIDYLLKSAERARRAYLNAEARELYARAADWLDRYPNAGSQSWRMHCYRNVFEGRGDILILAGHHDEGQVEFHRALALTGLSGVAVARLHRKIAASLVLLRRYEKAQASFDEAETALASEAGGRDEAWWYEWSQIKIDRIWSHYWRNQVSEMGAIVADAGGEIERRASPLQLVKFYQALTALGFRVERYRLSRQTRSFAESALAALDRAGETSEAAFTHFMMAFTALWMDDFATADEEFEHALEWAQRTGDVTVESRILTYAALLKRRMGDTDAVRERVDKVLPVATAGQMLEYIGTANANLAWLALRAGDLELAKKYATTAVETWDRLPIVYSFTWTRVFRF